MQLPNVSLRQRTNFTHVRTECAERDLQNAAARQNAYPVLLPYQYVKTKRTDIREMTPSTMARVFVSGAGEISSFPMLAYECKCTHTIQLPRVMSIHKTARQEP